MRSWQSLLELQPAVAVTSKAVEICPPGLPFLASALGPGSQSQALKGQQLFAVQGDLQVLGNEGNKDVQEPLKRPPVALLPSGRTTQPSQPDESSPVFKDLQRSNSGPHLVSFYFSGMILGRQALPAAGGEPALETHVIENVPDR